MDGPVLQWHFMIFMMTSMGWNMMKSRSCGWSTGGLSDFVWGIWFSHIFTEFGAERHWTSMATSCFDVDYRCQGLTQSRPVQGFVRRFCSIFGPFILFCQHFWVRLVRVFTIEHHQKWLEPSNFVGPTKCATVNLRMKVVKKVASMISCSFSPCACSWWCKPLG